MIAIVVVMRVHQLEKVRLQSTFLRGQGVSSSRCVLLVHLLLNELVKNRCIFLLDELMALFKASRQETNVFETFAIKHFYDEFEYFVMEVPDVEVIVSLTR